MKSKHPLWSATPTPFDDELRIDFKSVERMIEHHIRLGIEGIMLGGSCGEGPWMPVEDLEELVRSASRVSGGRIRIAAQVTDNSSVRMLRHAGRMAQAGADAIVMASPHFMMNATPERVFATYREVIEGSPVPAAYYDRGTNDRYRVDNEHLADLLDLPNLFLVKDSSLDPERAAAFVAARDRRPGLKVLTGDEFDVAGAIQRGMDGGFLGGAIFNAPRAWRIMEAAAEGRHEEARQLQEEMNAFMLRVYGPGVRAWLTGLKYFLFRMGLFSWTASYLEYPLVNEDQQAIDALFESPLREQDVDALLGAASGVAA